VICCPVQVVIEPVCDLSPGEGGEVRRGRLSGLEQLFPGERVCWEVVPSRECPAPASGSETS
jgi:hypothetical protein